jgi:soluble lytic murein transglycosylase-like protein
MGVMPCASRPFPLIRSKRSLPPMGRVWLAGAVLACGLLPASAFADVMEIGADGAVWVAGGPPLAVANSALEPDAELFAGDDAAGSFADQGLATDRAMYTDAAGTAGPARWQTRVAELAAKYDISPTLFEALVWQESRWNEGARSPVGARGIAQLMPGTAAQMGVNPDDPHANLEGGARYLRQQLDTFGGDIEKALAAYNAGPGRVHRAGGIPAITETRKYVAAIMARLTDPVRR